jgi:hypothetical protein
MRDLDCKPALNPIDENSPLMVATRRAARHGAGADESSKSALYMFLLTVSIGG